MQPQLVAVLFVSLFATASTSSPSFAAQDRTSQGFVLEAGEHLLGDIFDRASKFLGRNYFYPKAEMNNQANSVVIQKKLNLDVIGCEEVVSQLAYMKGFAILPIDPLRGLYDVISNRGQRVAEIGIGAVQMGPDEVLRKSKLKMMVLTSVSLKHIDAARAAQQLRPFFNIGGGRNGLSFGNVGAPRSLLLQGYSTQVASAIRLLREVDKPQESDLPNTYNQQLRDLSILASQQVNAMKAMKKRLADLEAQFATFDTSSKKK